MAAKNRTQLKALITAWAATLDLEARHKPDEQEILDSVLLNRDVVNTLAGTSIAANFTGYDSIIVNASGNVTITVSNIAVGESKTLTVNKTAGQTITFSGATDQSVDTSYVTALTKVVYEIYSKESGVVIANPKVKTGAIVTLTDGAWNEATLGTSWTGVAIGRQGMFYRLNKIGQLEVSISVYHENATFNTSLTTLPEGFRPAYKQVIQCQLSKQVAGHGACYIDINTNGTITVNQLDTYAVPFYLVHTFVIPLT